MTLSLLLVGVACAARTEAIVRPPVEATDGFVIRAGERAMGGAAVVSVTDTSYALLGLGPTGSALFTIRAEDGEVEVTAPDDGMAAVLRRLPVERDLWLLYRLRCEDRCRADHGTITVVPGAGVTTYAWRGLGGKATMTLADGAATLEDTRRGYAITVRGPGVVP